MAILRYRVRCTTDSKFEYWLLDETAAAPTTCPTNTLHSISDVTVVSTITDDISKTAEGVVRTVPQPQSVGLEMCDRDILIKTATYDPYATLTINGVDSDGDVTYTRTVAGSTGNNVQIAHITGSTGIGFENRALAVSVTLGIPTVIDVIFSTNGFGQSMLPTAGQVETLINTDPLAALFVVATKGGDGSSHVGTQTATSLTGGITNSLEDVKIDPLTGVKTSWEELALVGVFKSNGGNGYTPCVDQTDATTNAILSIWRYTPHNQTTGLPCSIEIRDGYLIVDADITASLEHQAYAIAAPLIPASVGGSILQFDAYLKFFAGKMLGVTSPTAKVLNPYGPAGLAGGELRIYMYYPALTQNNHILRIVTYRPAGTF